MPLVRTDHQPPGILPHTDRIGVASAMLRRTGRARARPGGGHRIRRRQARPRRQSCSPRSTSPPGMCRSTSPLLACTPLPAASPENSPALRVHPIVADFGGAARLPFRIGSRAAPRISSRLDHRQFLTRQLPSFPRNGAPNAWRRIAASWSASTSEGTRDPDPAYDDAEGVTAAFNRNLLYRLNREADADFEPTILPIARCGTNGRAGSRCIS